MKIGVEEGFKMWRESRTDETTGTLDGIAYCLFEDYSAGISGYEHREYLRAKRPSVYEELAKVKTLEDFTAIIARYKFEMEEK